MQPWEEYAAQEQTAAAPPPIAAPQGEDTRPPWELYGAPAAAPIPQPVENAVEAAPAVQKMPWEEYGGVATPPTQVSKEAQVNAEKPWAVTRGFVSSILEHTPEAFGGTLEGLAHLVPPSYKQTFLDASTKLRAASKGLRPEEYKMVAPGIFDVKNLDEGFSSVGEIFGQGVGSTVLPAAGGAAGAVAGSAVAPGIGTLIGAGTGAAIGGLALNFNDVYEELKKNGVAPERAAPVAAKILPLISALDVAGMAFPAAKLLGVNLVKSAIAKEMAKEAVSRGIVTRVGVEAGKGIIGEGTTEALQEAAKLGTVSAETGKDFFTQANAKKIAESFVGGAIVGGPFGGVAGIQRDPMDQPGQLLDEAAKKKFMNDWEQSVPPEWVQNPAQEGSIPGLPMGDVQIPAEDIKAEAPQVDSGIVDATTPVQMAKVGAAPVSVMDTEPAMATPGSDTEVLPSAAAAGLPQPQLPPLGPDAFYSRLIRQVTDKGPNAAPASEWQKMLDSWVRSGIKQEEVEWLAAPQYLSEQTGKVSKQDFLTHLNERFAKLYPAEHVATSPMPQVEIVSDPILGHRIVTPVGEFRLKNEIEGEPDVESYNPGRRMWYVHDAARAIDLPNFYEFESLEAARNDIQDRVRSRTQRVVAKNEDAVKYEKYVHPGPRGDYFEMKLQMPNAERLTGQPPYRQGHFREFPNTIVSVMVTERRDSSGNTGVLIDALQSDLHQQGRTSGYIGVEEPNEEEYLVRLRAARDTYGKLYEASLDVLIQEFKILDPMVNWSVAEDRATGLLSDFTWTTKQLPAGPAREAKLQGEFAYAIESNPGMTIAPELQTMIASLIEAEANFEAIQAERPPRDERVPNLPLKDTKQWSEFAIKRMIRWAQEKGYRRIYFPQGEKVGEYNTGGASDIKQLKGINYFYNTIVPSVAKKLAKQIGADFGQVITGPAVSPNIRIEMDQSYTGQPRYQITDDYSRDYGVYRDKDYAEFMLAQLKVQKSPDVWNYIQLSGEAVADTSEVFDFSLFTAAQPPKVGTVRVTPKVKEGALVNPLYNAAIKMAHAIDGWVKSAGITEKVYIQITDKIPTPVRGSKGLVQGGYARKNKDGSYTIQLNLRLFKKPHDLWVSMIHEFGHVIYWSKFLKLSVLEQQAIKSAYNRTIGMVPRETTVDTLLKLRDNAVLVATGWRGNHPTELRHLPKKDEEYWAGFIEWFPEQVARWATTNENALTLVDQIMKGIGTAIRKMVEAMSKKFGLNYAPMPAMQKWLDSFLNTTPPMVWPDTYKALDRKGKKKNEDVVAKEVPDTPMPPPQDVNVGPRLALEKVFTPPAGATPAPPPAAGPPPTGPSPPLPPGAPPPSPTSPIPPSGNLPPTAPPQGPTPPGAIPPPVAAMAAHADRINWFYKYMTGLGQLVAANPLFKPLLDYHQRIKIMHNEEVRIQDAALRISKRWRRLGSMGDKLSQYLDYMANMNYRTPQEVQQNIQRHPTAQEALAEANRLQLNQEARDLILLIKNSFDGMLTLSVNNAIADAQKYISDPNKLIAEINKIRSQEAKMRNKPYFPFMRFGRYYVLAKDANGDTLHFETVERKGFMSAESRQSTLEGQIKAAYPGATITKGVLPESVEPLMGMPPLLLESMLQKMNLTQAQRDAVKQLQFELSPSLSFKHHFQNKNYVPGYSMDYQRSFARYFFHGARHITRVKHIEGLKTSIGEARTIPDNKSNKIADFMQDHLDNTILDARGDFGILKGGIFLWAMGFVPAAAAQNLSQIPMISLPFMGAKFGDIAATREIMKAMTDMTNFYKRGWYDRQTDFELRAISYGVKTGRISEAQAAELAGIGQGSNLLLGYGGNRAQRYWSSFQEKAAGMFEMAEQFNRRVTFRAALRLAMQKPNNAIANEAVARYPMEYTELVNSGQYSPAQARAIITASHVVDQTQYVYSRYDRPRFMRGRLSGTLFVFKKYMQSTLVMLGQNPDVLIRYLVITAALGGLAGIPGYDDFKSLLRAFAHWAFGKDFNLDRSVKEYVNQFSNGTIPSDMVLHGLARKGFGVPAMLDLMGSLATGTPGRGFDPGSAKNVPFPVLDRSRALSMGNILPVDLGKLIGPTKDVNATVAEQTQKASGAVFSVGFNMYKAIMDNHLAVSDPKRWERAVPRLLASGSRAFRAFTEGRERGSRGGPSSGTTVVPYDVRDPEQMMEILALAGGYTPVRVSEKWDNTMAKAEVSTYYKLQRDGLLEQYFEAMMAKNPGEKESVIAAIKKYNNELPDYAKGMALSGDTIKRSMQTRGTQHGKRELGIPATRGEVPLHRYIDSLYPLVEQRRVR